MGKIQVKPEDLKSAAAAVGKALTALSEIQAQGKAAQTAATQIHYEPAAGKADAVAQKATENLQLAHDALLGLQRGFLAAAGVYLSNDQLVTQDNDRYAASVGAVGAAGSQDHTAESFTHTG